MVFSFKYVATILLSLFLLYEIFLILIFSFIKSLNKLITCCFSVSVIGLVFLTLTFTFVSKIGFFSFCDFTSTVTCLLVSTSNLLSQGVKKYLQL